MDNSYAYNKRLMLILTVATTAVLAVFQAAMILFTAHSASDRGLVAYVIVMPIVFNALSYGLAYKDLEEGMDEDEIEYIRQRGIIFGTVIFVITIIAMAVLTFGR